MPRRDRALALAWSHIRPHATYLRWYGRHASGRRHLQTAPDGLTRERGRHPTLVRIGRATVMPPEFKALIGDDRHLTVEVLCDPGSHDGGGLLVDSLALIGAVVAYGAAWLLLLAGMAKLLAEDPQRNRARHVRAGWLAVGMGEAVAGVLALSNALTWPAACVLVGVGCANLVVGPRAPETRCGCFGRLDPVATFTVSKGLLFLILAAIVTATGLASAPLASLGDAVIARIAGLLIPIAVLGAPGVRRFREVLA